jgi:hypothetical protein
VLADGVTSTLSHSQNSNVDVFENVAELQISDSAFSAQYGIGGIIFNQISKGGTSKFHGTLYDYFQSSEFNSVGADFSTTAFKVGYNRYNNFGGSIGGPVDIPLMGLKKKAFFYFNYDQIVQHGAGANKINDIPTAAVMGGDFSGQSTIYDPTTQTIGLDSNGKPYPIRQTFASEYGSNAVPSTLIDTVSASFQKYYPTLKDHLASGQFITGVVNSRGVTQKNFISSVPNSTPYRKYFGRFDYDVNSRNRVTASVQQSDTPVQYPSAVTECPIGCQSGDVDNYVSQISDVWTISPHLINEARMGYTYQGNFFADLSLGAGQAKALDWQFAKADTIPNIQYSGNYPYAWIEPQSNAVYKEHVFDPSDVITLVKGKHVLHFGGEVAVYDDNSTAWGNTNAGTMQFSGQYTENWKVDPKSGLHVPDGSTGADYADFLLGYAENWSAAVSPEYGARIKDPQVFVQDDYKIRPNLTINLGLRYQIRKGWSEIHGNETVYDPNIVNPANNTKGAEWYGTTHLDGRTQLEKNTYSTVLPRVGFSWLALPSMTLRGGFGMYAYNLSLDTYGEGMGGEIASSGNYSDCTSGIYPATLLGGTGTVATVTSQCFGKTYGSPLPYTPASTDPTRFNGQSVTYRQYATPNPEILQWNFGMQKAIGSNMSVDLAYVASHGYNLYFGTDLNQVPFADLSVSDGADRPNPTFNQITGSTNNAVSNYNSLQAQVNRRLAQGISFAFSYTWSHFLDDYDSSGWGGRNGPTTRLAPTAAENYSNSNFDIRNAFKGRIVYELPFGRGRAFLNHNFLVDEALGGFQLSSTIQLTSGNPWSLVDGSGVDSYTEPGNTTSPFLDWASPNHRLIAVPGGRNQYEWVNPANFKVPEAGTYGTLRRNALYGPGLELVNLSAAKKFDIHENVKLQLRLDATNAFNHTNLGQPTNQFKLVDPTGTYYLGNGNQTALGAPNGQITGTKATGRQLQAGFRVEF